MGINQGPISLDQKYTQGTGHVFLTGIQALVRLPMAQIRRDRAAGLNTTAFISGYRGSPLGGYDQQLFAARKHLEQYNIKFQPGVNEDLAATAVWGSQQLNLSPGANYDGVVGIWYGKGPGVDRCGDVFRHGNAAGSAKNGGVLCLAGDDHGAKSSTVPHQSDHAFISALMPYLYPSSIHEMIEMGLLGIAMSRYTRLLGRHEGHHRDGGDHRRDRSHRRDDVDAGVTSPGEIVVLFAAGTDAEWFEEELRAVGLPTYRAAGRNYFGQQQVADLLSYLRAPPQPLRRRGAPRGARVAVRRRVERRARPDQGGGTAAAGVPRARASAAGRPRGGRPPAPARLSAALRALARRSRTGAPRVPRRGPREHDYDLAILALPDGRRRYANLRKLARLARSYEELRGASRRGPPNADLYPANKPCALSSRQRQNRALVKDRQHQLLQRLRCRAQVGQRNSMRSLRLILSAALVLGPALAQEMPGNHHARKVLRLPTRRGQEDGPLGQDRRILRCSRKAERRTA